jgi:hypothetical protein
MEISAASSSVAMFSLGVSKLLNAFSTRFSVERKKSKFINGEENKQKTKEIMFFVLFVLLLSFWLFVAVAAVVIVVVVVVVVILVVVVAVVFLLNKFLLCIYLFICLLFAFFFFLTCAHEYCEWLVFRERIDSTPIYKRSQILHEQCLAVAGFSN